MCKWNKWGDTRIDPCMRSFMENLSLAFEKTDYNILACCCGHGKYPMTIVVGLGRNLRYEIVSGKYIPRKKKFYKKDKQGYYYIPEVVFSQNEVQEG